MREYIVVYEQGPNNWSAYSPDVPGCVAAGETLEETEQLFKEALELHIESMLEDGEPLPQPQSRVGKVRIDVA